MIDVDKWQEIFSSLGRHKLRTFLTAFSVWWGIFMLVILLGAGKGLQNSVEHDFKDDAVNTLWIWTNETSVPYKGLPIGRQVQFENDDLQTLGDTKGIRHKSSRYFLDGNFFISYKDKSLAFNVQTVSPEHIYIETPVITKGRWINDLDMQQFRKVAIIGEAVKREFFPDEEAIDKYIKIKGVEYQVVGIFTEQRERETQRIYLPIATAQKIDGTKKVHTLTAELGDIDFDQSTIVEENVRQQLNAQHKISPEDRQAIGIWNGAERVQEFRQLFGFIRIFIWFVGIGSIIAGVIGVSNIMLIIVKDRTKEIGIRKAIGATPFSIVSMIVQEAVFLTSFAGYIGLASGLGLIHLVQTVMEQNNLDGEFFRNPEVELSTILIALVVLVISGVFSGLIPAMQAAKVNPVVAMKGG
ncbi:MAG: ABC transporter permease [Saprospiraceae bacterium]